MGKYRHFVCHFLSKFEPKNNILQNIVRILLKSCKSEKELLLQTLFQCDIVGNASVLQIVNTNVLGAGTHEVECILQPNIHQNYTNDVSFRSKFNENITRTATLEVMMEVTSTMSEFHCFPFSHLCFSYTFPPNVVSC